MSNRTESQARDTAVTGKQPHTVRKLTHSLISMAHRGDLVCFVVDEMHTMELPMAGQAGKVTAANVLTVIDESTGEEAILILNSVMKSALERAGGSLSQRRFHFKAGDIREGKRYRDVQVEEWF